MNDKFFDLKKEKQDRMINAGLRVFALNGYHHASTDDIVKEARISKGLLFHYFSNKAGYYSFLYDYITRFAILELSGQCKNSNTDFFDFENMILEAESKLMTQYPFIYLFLESVKLESDGEGLSALDTSARDITSFYNELYEKTDLSSYLHSGSKMNLIDMIHYIKIGVMREVLIDRTNPVSLYYDKASAYIRELRKMSSGL